MFTKKSQSARSASELDDTTKSAPASAVAKMAGTTTPRANAAALPTAPVPSPTTKLHTKRALVIGMLSREESATLAELCAATGWQAHTVRAALTGLRKGGHVLEKSTRGGATCYQIVEPSHGPR